MRKGHIIGFIFTGFLISACTTNPKILPAESTQVKNRVASVTDVSELSADQRSQLYYSILLARLAEKQQLLDIAQSNYQDALAKTQSPKLAGHSIKIALQQKDYQAANQALSIWQKNAPASNSPKKIALLIALHKRQPEQALEELVAIFPPKLDATEVNPVSELELDKHFKEILSFAYSKTLDGKDLEQQLIGVASLLELYNDQYPNSPYACSTQTAEAFLKLKSRSPLSQLTRIHKLLDQVIEAKPKFNAAITTKVQALALTSDNKSQAFLKQILKNQSLNKSQVMELSNLAYRQKDYDSAAIGFKRVLDSEPDNSEAQFLLAGSYFANKDYETASDLFYQLAIDDYRKAASAFYCGDAAERHEDIVKSLSCLEMVPFSQYFLEARQRMATIYANQEMYKVGAESLEKAQSLVDFNQRQMLLKYEVNYLLEYQQFELAKQRLESAIQLDPNNGTIYYLQLLLADKTLNQTGFLAKVKQLQSQAPDIKLRKEVTFSAVGLLTDKKAYQLVFELLDREYQLSAQDLEILYARALSNEPLNRYDRLEKDLRLLLSIDPEHHNAKNALGYTLADLNKNLEEAKLLIEAAYEAEPENDAILDSMGWVQYRLGNLPAALKYIQMSYDKAPVPENCSPLR